MESKPMWDYYNFMQVAGLKTVNGQQVSANWTDKELGTNYGGNASKFAEGLNQGNSNMNKALGNVVSGSGKTKSNFIKSPVGNMNGAPVSKGSGNGLPNAQTPTTQNPQNPTAGNKPGDNTVHGQQVQGQPQKQSISQMYPNDWQTRHLTSAEIAMLTPQEKATRAQVRKDNLANTINSSPNARKL